jgi:hypothetical protein
MWVRVAWCVVGAKGGFWVVRRSRRERCWGWGCLLEEGGPWEIASLLMGKREDEKTTCDPNEPCRHSHLLPRIISHVWKPKILRYGAGERKGGTWRCRGSAKERLHVQPSAFAKSLYLINSLVTSTPSDVVSAKLRSLHSTDRHNRDKIEKRECFGTQRTAGLTPASCRTYGKRRWNVVGSVEYPEMDNFNLGADLVWVGLCGALSPTFAS